MPILRHQGEDEDPERDSRKEWPVRWKENQPNKTCPDSEVKENLKE